MSRCREAILLVGGRGTRLRPLTRDVPKPMLPTAGVPLIAHQLVRLREAGVGRVILATCYHADVFADSLGDGSQYGLEVVCATEGRPLGTAGAIRNAADRLGGDPQDPVVVLNGDVLSGHDLAGQVARHEQRHRKNRPSVTLHLTEVADARSFGCVPIDARGLVGAFHEKSPEPVTNRVNAGAYVFTRQAISRIPTGTSVSLEHDVFPALIEEGSVLAGYADPAYWLDVGTPAAYVRGSADLVLGRLESRALPGPPGESLVLKGANIAPVATVDGGTVVGEGATVGTGAEVSGSVLLDGAIVEEGAVVRDSALARGARVGAGAVLDGAVVGESVIIGSGNELRHGVRIWPGTELPAGAIRFSSDI